MTDTFLDCAGCAWPILGTDAISGLSLSSDILNIPISFSASVCEVTFHVLPARDASAGQRQPVEALDECGLQHSFGNDGVSTITKHFVLWVAEKEANLGICWSFSITWRGLEKSGRFVPVSPTLAANENENFPEIVLVGGIQLN